MGYIDYETGETPEERRLRLLAEMGSPYLGSRPDADLGTIDSGGAFGFMPQGYNPQSDTTTSLLGTPWMDPGQAAGGTRQDYVDPPPRLGNLFSKPGEPAQPELDGILFNGTRSAPGRGVLAQETPAAAIPGGPIALSADLDVTGANNQDRSNAPKSPDEPFPYMPETAAAAAPPVGLPTMAGALGKGPAAAYASTPPVPGVGAPAAGAASPATSGAPSALPQPQVAATADGLSRKPGSPAAMTWLQDNADLFIALGAGLLSGKNIGEGIIQGLRLANEQKSTSAKQKLLDEKNQAEHLKQAAYAAKIKQAFPDIPADQAVALAQNQEFVNRALKITNPDPSSPDWVTETLPDGTKIQRNTKTGKTEGAPGAKPEEPERPLTDPAERAKWGIDPNDKKPYSIKGNEAPKVLTGGGQTINVNTGQDKLVEIAADQFKGHLAAVDQARQTLQATAAMRDQLNAPGGVITGAAAGDRLALQKLGSLFGVADPSAITNTEAFKAAAGPLVLATVKGLGTGASITNSDRDFAEAMAGGRIELNESSIRRMIDIQEQLANDKMRRSQGVINQLIQTNPNLANMAPLLTAPPPDVRPPAASQAAPPAPAVSAAPSGELTYDRRTKRFQ